MNNTLKTNEKILLLNSFNTNVPTMAKQQKPDLDFLGSIRKMLENTSLGQPIVAVADIKNPFKPDEVEIYIDLINSGKLAECFDGSFDISKYYISKNGDLCAYEVSRFSIDFCFYRVLKRNVPIALARHIFDEICSEKADMNVLYQLTNSIGYEVLDALGFAHTAYGDENGD